MRQFRGCGAEVIDLSLNPVDDSFLSCSKDRTVRLWNLQQPSTLAILDLPKAGNGYTLDPNGVPHASYDSTGLVFCITAPLDDGAGHVSCPDLIHTSFGFQGTMSLKYNSLACSYYFWFFFLLADSSVRRTKIFYWGICRIES